ncbi:MAG: mismatch-specific DNA-glycosylase [Dehalococcoidales bacterium]|nr:mismatch-specific DNA-glycosylase [Dehalococcoidales bacterium]
MADILPDLLKRNLKVVFCGMAVSSQSEKARAYYAGRGNKFWKTLWDVKLTSDYIHPTNYPELIRYDIGLTDLVKDTSGNDTAISVSPLDIENLRLKIMRYQPRVLAFTGKRSAELFLKNRVDYGFQDEQIINTRIFVLPSTSLQANGYWDVSYWEALSQYLKNQE